MFFEYFEITFPASLMRSITNVYNYEQFSIQEETSEKDSADSEILSSKIYHLVNYFIAAKKVIKSPHNWNDEKVIRTYRRVPPRRLFQMQRENIFEALQIQRINVVVWNVTP